MTQPIIWKAKPSQLMNIPFYFIYLVAALSWTILPQNILMEEVPNTFAPWLLKWHVAVGLSIIVLLPAIVVLLKTACTRYELTNERLLVYSGVLNRKREVVELYRIKDNSVRKPLFIRIFGYAHIYLVTSDRTAPLLKLACIKDGYKIEDLIRGKVEERRRATGVREFD